MPKLSGLQEKMHYDITFRFYCDKWAFACGLACGARQQYRAGNLIPWDHLEDIGVGLVQAGKDVGNEIIERSRAGTKEGWIAACELLPDYGGTLHSDNLETIKVDQSWVALGIVTPTMDIPDSTSYISVIDKGSDRERARVSLNTLAAVRMAINREDGFKLHKNSSVELHPVEGLKFVKPIPFSPNSTIGLGLHINDLVPLELTVTLIGVKTRSVI